METMQLIERFVNELRRQEKSANTTLSYRYDLVLFARWLEATSGQPLAADRITLTDLREYQAYLLTVEQRSPGHDQPTARQLTHLPPLGPRGRALQGDPDRLGQGNPELAAGSEGPF